MPTVCDITITLLNGVTDGILLCKKPPHPCQVYIAPISKLSELNSVVGASPSGGYILIGKTHDGTSDCIYVGQSTNIPTRLQTHYASPPSNIKIEKIIVINSYDSSLLQNTGSLYLEATLIKKAMTCMRIKLINTSTPNIPSVTPSQKSLFDGFIDEAATLIALLGFSYFEPVTAPTPLPPPISLPTFTFMQAGRISNGRINGDKFILIAGSTIKPKKIPDINYPKAKKLRSLYATSFNHTNFITTNDIVFDSANQAAIFVSASSISGTKRWKAPDGTTPADY